MLTKYVFSKKSSDANFQLWSQNTFFPKVPWPFSKMDIYKCPNFNSPFGLLEKIYMLI